MKKSADWRIEACCEFKKNIGALCITLRHFGGGVASQRFGTTIVQSHIWVYLHMCAT